MKWTAFIILFAFAPSLVIAQDLASPKSVSLAMNEHTAVPQLPIDHRGQLAADSLNNSSIEASALYGLTKFVTDPYFYVESKQADSSETGLIQGWRERVFKTISTNFIPVKQNDLRDGDGRLVSNTELEQQTDEGKMIQRIVAKESLRYIQERVPQIDTLVKALTFQISNDKFRAQEEKGIDNKPDEPQRASHEDKLLVTTGLRIPTDGGKMALLSQTEATYSSTLSMFFKVKLDKQFDNSLGLTYLFNKDIRLQALREITAASTGTTGENGNLKSTLDLVQLVCRF